jgi:hypothetical protein
MLENPETPPLPNPSPVGEGQRNWACCAIVDAKEGGELGILPEIFSEVIGREIIQGRMNSRGVVEAVDSAGDRLAGSDLYTKAERRESSRSYPAKDAMTILERAWVGVSQANPAKQMTCCAHFNPLIKGAKTFHFPESRWT